jgi:tRNA(fMet)-specific endonuclease VapC
MLVLDTNTISHYFRGDPKVVGHMQAIRPSELGVPAIVEYELRYGLLQLPSPAGSQRLEALAQLLAPMQRLPFDSQCASHAARIRADLEHLGTPIGAHDILIAATAFRHQIPLVTRNTREFSRVRGLQCIDWHSA